MHGRNFSWRLLCVETIQCGFKCDYNAIAFVRVCVYCAYTPNKLCLGMAGFFKPNISHQGRIARGITGSVILIVGIILADETLWASIPLVVIGLFCMFEAVRGWCFLRACGIRTKV